MDENLLFTMDEEQEVNDGPVTCLGITFENDEKRREYFREELRKKLPELRLIEGFPNGEDNDIINLSDPPYYTVCPNPWINDLVKLWEDEKNLLEKTGKRTSDFTIKEPYTADVSEGKNNPIYMAHSYHTKVPHPAIMRYLFHYTQPGDIVFDGFCGTGMTGVAANMCGSVSESNSLSNNKRNIGSRHSICSDLSPIATLIASSYNTKNNYALFKKKANAILDQIEKEFGWMYETLQNGKKSKINYTIWSECFTCPHCGKEIVLWDSAVNEDGSINDLFRCPGCGAEITKKQLHKSSESVYDHVLEDTVLVSKFIPVVVNYTSPSHRSESRLNNEDVSVIQKIDSLPINNLKTYHMPEGSEASRNCSRGIDYTHQFFTKRNLIIIDRILGLAEKDPYIVSWLTSSMINISKMWKYKPDRKGGSLSGTLYIPSLFIEQNPFEVLRRKITAFGAADYNEKGNGVVSLMSACSLTQINSASVDYIFIDPPFGANIMYSELSYIWESWLKVFTNTEDEAIVDTTAQKKSLFDYQDLMHRSLKEFYRILKAGRWLTMEFSNTSASVWNSIQTALQGVGFVVANVSALDKQQGSFKSINSPVAVKQDLIITCFKPTDNLIQKFENSTNICENVWDFVEELLNHLPVHVKKDHSTTAVIERSPKILFDRLIAYYIQRGYPVPIDAAEFQRGLKDRFVERDGMYFTAEQAIEYEEKKKDTTDFVSLFILVGSEAEGIEWLKRKLEDGPKTYAEILPDWMQDLVKPKKGDSLPELMQILDENFLKDENGYWHIPDVNDQAQLEVVRNKRLLKEFDVYVEAKKIKDARLEALRAGFKECYKNKDFATIVNVGDKIPEELLTTDDVLLQYYDIASSRV